MMRLAVVIVLIGGCSSSSPPAADAAGEPSNQSQEPWFQDDAGDAGVQHVYHSGDTGKFFIIETMGGGAALFDYDKDGDLDLYLTQGNVLDGDEREDLTNVLYENTGDGQFVDRTAISGTGDVRYGVGVTTGDYDNDGWVDLYVTNYGRNTLLRNKGDGTFEDVTQHAGVGQEAFSACAEFADIDLDGDLDLFVTNYLAWTTDTEKPCYSDQDRRDYCNPSSYDAPIADTLYINNGNGTFRDASVESGIAAVSGTGLGIAIAPIDQDQWPDIFVANDGMNDRLWINQGDGTFLEQGMMLGCAVDDSGKKKASMGVELMDIDHDGDLDLLVTTLFRETDSFFINENGVYIDATARYGLAADTRTYTRWGIAVADFDNDGVDDLYEATGRVRWQADNWDTDNWLAEPNLLFTRQAGERFTLVEPSGGVEQPLIAAAHGVATGDIDGDGGIDLVVVNKDDSVNVLRNRVSPRGHWIMLDVRNSHDGPGIGAVVDIQLADGTHIPRLVRVASGYASAGDYRTHLGLGDEETVQSVRVNWPDGSVKAFDSLSRDTVHVLRP